MAEQELDSLFDKLMFILPQMKEKTENNNKVSFTNRQNSN